jgi:hypothetical protein
MAMADKQGRISFNLNRNAAQPVAAAEVQHRPTPLSSNVINRNTTSLEHHSTTAIL